QLRAVGIEHAEQRAGRLSAAFDDAEIRAERRRLRDLLQREHRGESVRRCFADEVRERNGGYELAERSRRGDVVRAARCESDDRLPGVFRAGVERMNLK